MKRARILEGRGRVAFFAWTLGATVPAACLPVDRPEKVTAADAPAEAERNAPAVPTLVDQPSDSREQSSGETFPVIGGVQPSITVRDQAAAACAEDAGSCSPLGDAGVGPTCVPTGPRDCNSDLDNDCDGQPDNVVDDVCVCAPGTSEACAEHPDLDGHGPCRAGLRTCVLGADGLTSEWGACEGSVGPGGPDSCTVRGDDADCDGTPNTDCPCVDGDTQECGSPTDTGPCAIGTSTCVNGRFGACVGAVPPAAQDSCAPGDDSNCNARSNDRFCTCLNGATQQCGVTATGVCELGTQTCINGSFGQCVGARNPGSRDCRSQQDNNCNGQPDNARDNVCSCSIGATQACQTHPGLDGVGRCRAGIQTCVAGAGNSSSSFGACTGSQGPLARDCRLAQDNDCDGRPDNTIDNVCQCIPGQGNGPCSGNPNNSRCNDQGRCAPCQSNGDCSLVSGGRNTCADGVCVQPLLGDGSICVAATDCASGICSQWFRDADGDGFGAANGTRRTCGLVPPTGFVPNSVDCCDASADIFPNQSRLFSVPQTACEDVDPFDYNCNRLIEKDPTVSALQNSVCASSCDAVGFATPDLGNGIDCGQQYLAARCVPVPNPQPGLAVCFRQLQGSVVGRLGCR